MSNVRCVAKEIMVYIHNGILFSYRRICDLVFHDNFNGTGNVMLSK